MATQDWGSMHWSPTLSFALPTERQLAQGSVADAGRGAENKFAPTAQNAALMAQLGYGGQAFNNEGNAWSDAARTWMSNAGYNVGVAHDPGTTPGGRPEYYGLMGPNGKWVNGQSDPTMTMSDTLADQIATFAMFLGPVAGGIAAAGGAAGGAGAAGVGTLGAAETGVSALGSAWSPGALGLTGGAAAGTSAAELAALGSALPGAVGGGAALGGLGAAAAGGGGGAATSVLPAVSVTGTSAGAAGGLTAGQAATGLGAAGAGAGTFTPSQNYGEGMNGLQTSAYDNTLGLTGSTDLANAAANSDLMSSIWKSPTTKSLADMFSGMGSNSSWVDLLKSGMSLYQASQMSKNGTPSPAAQTAGSQLDALLKDPSSMTKLPGWEAGLEAVQRSGAANGYLDSGNMMIGLQKYGGDFYNNTLRQLSAIANEGRGIDQQYNFAATDLTGHAINNFGYGLTKLFGD